MARVYTGLDVHSDQGGTFPWESRRVEVSPGISQAFVDEGPRDAPLTFLCLHGNPTWSYLYRRFIRALSPTYRVIAVDHVGFGRSDKPSDPAYYTLDRHVRNLTAVLDSLDAQRVVPIVQDWGGPIGMGWAAAHPDRVAGAVVLNTWCFVTDPPMALPWLFLGKGGWRRSTRSNIFVELFLIRGGKRKLSPAEANAYRAPFPTPAERVGIARFPQLIPPSAQPSHETWQTMRGIEDSLAVLRDKPALICWALKDLAFKKPAMERWTRVFAKVDGPHLLPNAAHYLQEDAPEAILEQLERWAKGLAPASS
jgi:pimeloyl-ACP methyl ester carboxylesterase